MEVIIRDEKMPKNCYECSYLEICSLKSNFEPTISKCPLKSLTQHDAELKAKWCDLIITILDYEIIPLGDSKKDWYVKSKFIYLQEKLKEMKGEKDE